MTIRAAAFTAILAAASVAGAVVPAAPAGPGDPGEKGVLVSRVSVTSQAGGPCRAEAAPIARFRGGKFEEASFSLGDSDNTCERLSVEKYPLASLPKLTAYWHGEVLGEIVPKKIGVSSFDCTDVCVGESECRFRVPPNVPRRRSTAPNRESFDLTALSADVPQPAKNSIGAADRKNLERAAVRLAEEKIHSRAGKRGVASLAQFETFPGGSPGETGAFVFVVSKRGKETVGGVTMIILSSMSRPVVAFSELTEIGEGGFSGRYSFLDWIDIDGDGSNEILARFDQEEMHEFVIFRRAGNAYRIAFRGGGFGC